jgi:hypothetical protein
MSEKNGHFNLNLSIFFKHLFKKKTDFFIIFLRIKLKKYKLNEDSIN